MSLPSRHLSSHAPRLRTPGQPATFGPRNGVARHAGIAMPHRTGRQPSALNGMMRIMALLWLAALPQAATGDSSHHVSTDPFVWQTSASASAGTCAPASTAAPCAQGDAASLAASEPALNLGIGNPVHLATGAKHQTDIDLPASATHPDLEIVRHYNSLRMTHDTLGMGWRLSYDTRLVATHDGAHIVQANGARIPFHAQTDPAHHGRLHRSDAGWQWHWPDGRRLDFDAHGYLIGVARPGFASTTIVRHGRQGNLAHAIAEIRQGDKRLAFAYAWQDGAAHLRSITSPAGRFDYQVAPLPDATQGSDGRSGMRLEAVTRPDGMQRIYLHEAAHQSGNAALLTGIVLAMPGHGLDTNAWNADSDSQDSLGSRKPWLRPPSNGRLRIGAWDYDAQGRATGASYGERLPRDGYSRIRYQRLAADGQDGLTLVDGPADQTRFDTQWRDGRAVLHRVSGAWCHGCARPGIQADYDARGRLLTVNGTRLLRENAGAGNRAGGNKRKPGEGQDAAGHVDDTADGNSNSNNSDSDSNGSSSSSGSGSGSGSGNRITAIIPNAPGWPGLHIDPVSPSRHDALPHDALTYRAPAMVRMADSPIHASWRQWRTTLTGTTTQADDITRRLATQRFANGDVLEVAYDKQGRPQRIHETAGAARDGTSVPSLVTVLQWDGPHLRCLRHPHATECREYDTMGRLTSRTERRPMRAPDPVPQAAPDAALAPLPDGQHRKHDDDAWQFTERFHYDAMHRLVRHDLPEGGSLHYTWAQVQRLTGIVWQRADGQRQTVIATIPGTAGYRHGNGLHLWVYRQGAADMTLSLDGPDGAYWRHTRQQDANGLVLRETHAMRALPPGRPHLEDWRYAYDRQARLAGVQHGDATTWMAWHPDGALAASTERRNGMMPPVIRRDAAGLPVAIGNARLEYGANLRLIAVLSNGHTLARYVHNAYGHRIRTIWPDGNDNDTSQGNGKRNSRGGGIMALTGAPDGNPVPPPNRQDYLYLDNRLVAQAQHRQDGRPPVITRRYLYAHHVPVGMIEYGPGDAGIHAGKADRGSDSSTNGSSRRSHHDRGNGSSDDHGELYAIHADLLGAPRLITDGQARIRWLATYTPLGDARRITGDMTLDMRLPGQWLEPATGWHDNLLRTYAPQWGHYLEPDPLGPLPGTQALGYADQQPRRYVDPMGLLLFAFDGTRLNQRTDGNILKLSALYADGASYYHSGPGNPYFLDTDAATAHRAPQILLTQWQHLLNALSAASASSSAQTAIPIDVIGFSRGAALARHFGNLIADHTSNGLFSYQDSRLGLVSACIDLRFMGLLDTVAQFGLGGSQNDRYRLGIHEAWQWVAHAVALHEHRWLFPLASADDVGNHNVVQAPFIGAHADIGGGTLLDGSPQRQGDLHDIALNWLWWQAQAAGVTLLPPRQDDQTVSAPILHDERSALQRTLQNGDRRIDRADGTLLLPYQADHDRLGQATRLAVEPLIRRYDDWRASSDIAVGQVDMQGYAQWLAQALGMPVER